MDAFRADAQPYKACSRSMEEPAAAQDPERKGSSQGAGFSEVSIKEAVDSDLEGLSDPGGELAALLNARKRMLGDWLAAVLV